MLEITAPGLGDDTVVVGVRVYVPRADKQMPAVPVRIGEDQRITPGLAVALMSGPLVGARLIATTAGHHELPSRSRSRCHRRALRPISDGPNVTPRYSQSIRTRDVACPMVALTCLFAGSPGDRGACRDDQVVEIAVIGDPGVPTVVVI